MFGFQEGDEAIVLAEISRKLNAEKIKTIRNLKELIRKNTNIRNVMAGVSLLGTIGSLFIAPVVALIPLITFLISYFYFTDKINKLTEKLNSIRSDYKIANITKVCYPLLITTINRNPVILDLGAHGKVDLLRYLDYSDKDNTLQELSKVKQINKLIREDILPASTVRDVQEKVKAIGKTKELERFRSIDGIFIPEVSVSMESIKDGITERAIPSRFIKIDENLEKELLTLLNNSKKEAVDMLSLESIYQTLIGIKLDEATRIGKEVFITAEELKEEEIGEGSIRMVKSIYDHINGYKAILDHMRELLESTIPSDPISFKMSINRPLCPECAQKYIMDIRERFDVKRWVELKILSGVMDDPDLNNPELIDKKDIEHFKRKIENFMEENLPKPVLETYVILSRPTILEGERELKCPKCGKTFNIIDLAKDGYLVPNVLIPLARGFATLFEEGKPAMMNKASTIIRNIHASKLSKNERITQLVDYKVHIEDLTVKLEEAKMKLEQSNEILHKLNRV